MHKNKLIRYASAIVISTLMIVGYAQAYTCPDLENDIASERLKQPIQGGFTTVEEKISSTNVAALKTLTFKVAEKFYKEQKAAGQLANPYQASLLVYESMLENEARTNQVIEAEIKRFGSLEKMALNFCKEKPDLQIESIYRSYFLTVQQLDNTGH